ncbi:MAG TPA: hypothetical protein VKO18_16255 [Terriglobia bacterium]|nr:hypothetical protein [Terriglobia bacterium]
MWRRPVVTILILVMPLILTLPLRAQQKPFTQEQVVSMVRDGFGDESGAKLIEQRGIDFAPSEDFYQTLKAAGASEAFVNALRAAKSAEPATAKKPINQVQIFALFAGRALCQSGAVRESVPSALRHMPGSGASHPFDMFGAG